MKKAVAFTALLMVVATLPAGAQDERADIARVRLTTDPSVPVGCTRIGLVRDDSIKDLRRKVVKAGGDTALLSFPVDDLEKIDAQVFRCPRIPPPPPGMPPPPPPS
jgi:ssRNA-specific RNase YbeY (16S rRNA maturation enzyme)